MKIAPSILSVDKKDYPRVIKHLEELNVYMLHLDVMDGKFVQNTTYDYQEVEKINKQTCLILDTHLMIEHPEDYVVDYIDAGSTYVTFHYEATTQPENVIKLIKSNNAFAGISIKPNTPKELLDEYLSIVDLVLVMSVEPGKGGQSFMESSLSKIKYYDEMRKLHNYNYIIEVDGGINNETIKLAKNAGADVVVVGSYLMNSNDIDTTYRNLKDIWDI